jgi:hypothetical protein
MHNTAPTSSTAAVQLRLKAETFTSVENWRRSQPKIPSRAEAIRQLIERALGEHEQRAVARSTQEAARTIGARAEGRSAS